MNTSRLLGLVLVSVAGLAGSARADAFFDGLKDYTGSYGPSYVLEKLTTFKVGKKCYAKLGDKNQGALHAASFATRDLMEYAKALTGEDWAALEGDDHEGKKDEVAKRVEAFKSKLSITVSVEGDDCDAGANSLWLRYWGTIVTALKKYPPPAGKVSITLDVTSKARVIGVTHSKDGSTFAFTGPKDIEAPAWSDLLEKPFRKVLSRLPDDFSFESLEAGGRYSSAWVLTKFNTFKLGKKCLAKLPDREKSGAVHAAGFFTRDVLQYAMAVGADDWDKIETQSANDPKTNRELVDKLMNEFKPRLSITTTVEGDDCDAGHGSLWLKYWSQIPTSLKNYPPKANKVTVTLNVTSKAKDVSVTTSKDGSTITITAPRDKEPAAWTDKYDTALKKVARKK